MALHIALHMASSRPYTRLPHVYRDTRLPHGPTQIPQSPTHSSLMALHIALHVSLTALHAALHTAPSRPLHAAGPSAASPAQPSPAGAGGGREPPQLSSAQGSTASPAATPPIRAGLCSAGLPAQHLPAGTASAPLTAKITKGKYSKSHKKDEWVV